jgi:membrane peptidoglycan carboxypeptidase
MKLKEKTNERFNIKNFFDNLFKKKPSESRLHPNKNRLITDFNLASKSKLKNGKSKGKKSKFKTIAKKAAIFFSLSFLFMILIGILVTLGVVSAYSEDLPNIDKYFEQSTKLGKETIIVDRNNEELYRLRGDVVNERVALKDVPEKLQWAVLATEDPNFKVHKGIDPFALARVLACVANNYIRRNNTEACGGGSSITQQLIKLTAFTEGGVSDRSIDRKIKEGILAVKVEEGYKKEEILEFYLNILPEGREYLGIKTGSVYLYGEPDLNKLSLAQIAYLAGIPNNPEVYSPRGAAYNPDASKARATLILDRMLERKDSTKVTEEEINAAKADLDKVVFVKDAINKKAPHFVNEVINELDNDPRWKDQVPEGKKGSDYFRDKGYTIVTTVDMPTQALLENTIKNNTAPGTDFFKRNEAYSAAGVVMDVKSGEILGMVGSRDFYGDAENRKAAPEYNAATALRSMGSSVKPVLYMTGFTKGYNPLTPVPDLDIYQAPGYNPKNFDRGNCHFTDSSRTGRCDFVSVRQALRFSLNQPAVSMANMVGVEAFGEMYAKLTGRDDLKAQFKGVSAALGAANIPLVEQVHAYSTIADMGMYKDKKYILQIKDENGKVIYDNTTVNSKRVIEGKYPYMITDLNKDYWFFANDATIKNIRKTTDFAGKTGTSDTNSGPGDIIFMGYTPDVAIGMWAGNGCGAEECPLKSTASSDDIYKYIYAPFLTEFSKNTKFFKPSRFQRPEGVRTAAICNLTGNAYSEDCAKAGGKSLSDLVADGNLPKAENMIEKLTVVPCPDVLKLARDIDKDAGLAQEKYYVRFDKIFNSKFLSDQVMAKLVASKDPFPSQNCDITRTLQPPVVTINNPANGSTYSQAENLNINATVSSDIQISKVEIVVGANNQIVKTFTANEPIQLTLELDKSPIVVGNNKIQVIATNIKGAQTTAVSNITVVAGSAAAIINYPLSGSSITAGAAPTRYVQLTGRVVGATASNATFTITKTSGGGAPYTITIPANISGANITATWSAATADANDTYRIDLRVNGGTLSASSTGVKVIN